MALMPVTVTVSIQAFRVTRTIDSPKTTWQLEGRSGATGRLEDYDIVPHSFSLEAAAAAVETRLSSISESDGQSESGFEIKVPVTEPGQDVPWTVHRLEIGRTTLEANLKASRPTKAQSRSLTLRFRPLSAWRSRCLGASGLVGAADSR